MWKKQSPRDSVACCRSYHVCVKACGVENPRLFEHHMCANKHCSKPFPDLPRETWQARKDDYCGNCGDGRFKIVCGEPHPVKRCAAVLAVCDWHRISIVSSPSEVFCAGGGTYTSREGSRESLRVLNSGQLMARAEIMMIQPVILQVKGSISWMKKLGTRWVGIETGPQPIQLPCGCVGLTH
jgi:hypothetical protein